MKTYRCQTELPDAKCYMMVRYNGYDFVLDSYEDDQQAGTVLSKLDALDMANFILDTLKVSRDE